MGLRAAICLLVILVLLGIIGYIVGFSNENKSFNRGKCIKCGSKLRLFDFDSHGGRGYVCDKCNYTTWVSYKRIDRMTREED